jgi:tetratricopeptide (TPR) repeat protein
MRILTAVVLLTVLWTTPVTAADPLAEARRLYNLGQYDMAATMAREAIKVPATAESARLVLGRICLELYRRTADAADLTEARESLRAINPQALDRRERAELTVGLGETVFLEDRFGAASELFERVLDSSSELGAAAHERVVDWWASALERQALALPREARAPLYLRILNRMEKELTLDPTSPPGWYWLAAAARGSGNLDRAWNMAMAGWVTAMLAPDRGAALRADLDRLVVQGIIPDRAKRLQPRDWQQTAAVMLSEWDAFKANWTR